MYGLFHGLASEIDGISVSKYLVVIFILRNCFLRELDGSSKKAAPKHFMRLPRTHGAAAIVVCFIFQPAHQSHLAPFLAPKSSHAYGEENDCISFPNDFWILDTQGIAIGRIGVLGQKASIAAGSTREPVENNRFGV
jgi:hypothetical protein